MIMKHENNHMAGIADKDFDILASPYYEISEIPNADNDILRRMLKKEICSFDEIPYKLEFLRHLKESYPLSLYINKELSLDRESCLIILDMCLASLANVEDWTISEIEQSLHKGAELSKSSHSKFILPVEVAIRGSAGYLGSIFDVMFLLGKKETLRRIQLGIARLS